MHMLKCILTFICINGYTTTEIWESNWYMPSLSTWYRGFEDHVTLRSLTPDDSLNYTLNSLWNTYFELDASSNISEILNTAIIKIQRHMQLFYDNKSLKSNHHQLRAAFAYFICGKYKINTTWYLYRPPFCPFVCNLQNKNLCPRYRASNQAFKCHVLDSGLHFWQHACTCADVKQKLVPRLKKCLDANASTYTENEMPMAMPQDPWSLVKTYLSYFRNGFPSNYTYEYIVYHSNNRVDIEDMVSHDGYMKSFNSFHGTLYQKMLKVYSKYATLHNFDLRMPRRTNDMVISYADITSEEYALGILLYTCSENKNYTESDISRIIEICPNVCHAKIACKKYEICTFINNGIFVSDKICTCKPGYYRDGIRCVVCFKYNRKIKECYRVTSNKIEKYEKPIVRRNLPLTVNSQGKSVSRRESIGSVYNKTWSECSEKCGEGIQKLRYNCVNGSRCMSSATTTTERNCNTYKFSCSNTFRIVTPVIVLTIIASGIICFYCSNHSPVKQGFKRGGDYERNKQKLQKLQAQKAKHEKEKEKKLQAQKAKNEKESKSAKKGKDDKKGKNNKKGKGNKKDKKDDKDEDEGKQKKNKKSKKENNEKKDKSKRKSKPRKFRRARRSDSD